MGINRRMRKKRLNKPRFLTILAILIILGWSIGYMAAKINDSRLPASIDEDQNPKVTEVPATTKPAVSTSAPTLQPTVPPDGGIDSNVDSGENEDITKLKSELENYIDNFSGQYGIYYYNLADGTEFGINHTDTYVGASTTKVIMNLYLFKKIQEGSVDPQEKITYLKEDYEGGTGVIAYNGKYGDKYSIEYLSRQSIETSDNVATNMLYRYLNKPRVKDYMKGLGGTVVSYETNISCPRDLAIYMREVYKFYQEDEELGGQLMGYLMNTNFNDRITKLLPSDVKVAHKIGNQVKALHDVGIVFADKPYILAVMSKDINEAEGFDVIANISKKIYDSVK